VCDEDGPIPTLNMSKTDRNIVACRFLRLAAPGRVFFAQIYPVTGAFAGMKAAGGREKAMRLNLCSPGFGKSGSSKLPNGPHMTLVLNRMAWVAAALTVLAWAMLPTIVRAYPILFPKAPVVDSSTLPPVPFPDGAKPER